MRYTLQELSSLTGALPIGDLDHVITGVESLQEASSCELAFLENYRYAKQLGSTHAGAVFIPPTVKPLAGRNYLITPQPSLAFQVAVELFLRAPESGFSAIHESAIIHKEALIGKNVTIGPYAVIDRSTHINDNVVIGAASFIGAGVVVGSNCVIHPHVTIREGCIIGNRVVIQPGAVIGACGFGYHMDSTGRHLPLKQLGTVVIEDDVDIGANTTIDRARFKETRIRRGSKIDNLVQIAHQVEVGEDNLIVSQVGIAGSTKTGRNVVIGGQVGIAGHLTIADGVLLAARAGVSKSLLEKGPYYGEPAEPMKKAKTHYVQQRSIGRWIEKVKELEAKLDQLLQVTDSLSSHDSNPNA